MDSPRSVPWRTRDPASARRFFFFPRCCWSSAPAGSAAQRVGGCAQYRPLTSISRLAPAADPPARHVHDHQRLADSPPLPPDVRASMV